MSQGFEYTKYSTSSKAQEAFFEKLWREKNNWRLDVSDP